MEHILPYAQRHRLFPPGGLILCALSGGGDSVALLHFLKTHGFPVAAAHFDHHLRPNSGSDAAFARAFCQRLGVPFYLGEGEVGAMAGNVEENARNARYAFLEATGVTIGAAAIATAHTANDNLETVLMHLTRGCGLQGLTGIYPQRGNLVRPMLQTTRKEVERYLEENGLEYVTDQTNLDDTYVRNRIRHHVVPVLERVNPRVAQRVADMTEYLRQDEAVLKTMAKDLAGECAYPTPVGSGVDPHSPPILHRLPPGATLARSGVSPGSPPAFPPVFTPQTLLLDRILMVTTHLWAVELKWVESTPEYEPNPLNYYLSGTKTDVFQVRSRQTGDFLHPPNRTGKTVKKWMNELKIPEKYRDLTPILNKNGKIVAAAAIGPDRSALARVGEPSFQVIWYKL